jgi:chloramphenicol-sensitive protein RarD
VTSQETEGSRAALIAGVSCHLIWGFAPLLFQAIGHYGAGAWEIMAHRIIWGALSTGLLVWLTRQGRELAQALTSPKLLAPLALSAFFIANNWTVFIWSVNHGRMLESSLGYYITPLINMACGAFLFRERIDRFGRIAMGLAIVGVLIQAVSLGHPPWIALWLGFSFGIYGLIRKRVEVGAITGLLVECLVLLPVGIGYLSYLAITGAPHFGGHLTPTLLMIIAGPVTAAPLALFAWAARRMPLSTIGFLQFTAPTIGFIIGLSQGEPFPFLTMISFACIWGGAGVFIFGALRRLRMARLERAI